MATLIPEVVRFGPGVHAVFEKKMSTIADLIAQGFAGGSDVDRRTRAWSMLGVLIGGINMARAMKTTKASAEVSDAIKSAAIKAAGRTRAVVTNKI